MLPIAFAPNEVAANNVGRDYIDFRTTKVKNMVFHDNSKSGTLDRLVRHIAPGALHNSAERGPYAPKCHPETRKAVQQDIMGWIRHGDQDDTPRKILLLSGPAGSGKTAIMGTIADECHREGLLAASFFFSAFSTSVNRRSKTSFVLTLAYGLLQHKSIANLKEAILSSIEEDPAIFDKHLQQQLDQLILAPLQAAVGQSDATRWPKVIVIDAVDECEADVVAPMDKDKVHTEVLDVLARAAGHSAFPFRILIASRPEQAITNFFHPHTSPPISALRIFLDNRYDPDSDIRLFLKAKLGTIQRQSRLPSHWPAQDVVDLLVDRASGQFIYAVTVLRFVEDASRPPKEQLELVVNWAQAPRLGLSPFESLDSLYSGILRKSPNPELAGTWLVCFNLRWGLSGRIWLGLAQKFYNVPTWYKMAMLESPGFSASYLLGHLSSLVNMGEGPEHVEIILYHRSLLEFLDDPSRSQALHVSERNARQHIRDCFYYTLKNRGCRIALHAQHEEEFTRIFLACFTRWVDPAHQYEADDVAWWWTQMNDVNHPDMTSEVKLHIVRHIFFNVDKQCSRYRCRSSCKRWRNVIRKCCITEGWRRYPSWIDLLKDRIAKIRNSEYALLMSITKSLWLCFDNVNQTDDIL